MKIAILSDIHSNLEALTTALRALDQEGIDEFLCCGDILGYGPNPNECIELLKQHDARCIRGNHDAAALLQTDCTRLNRVGGQAIDWTRKQLSTENRIFLDQLPTMERIVMKDIPISLIHGSLADPLWGYILHKRDAYLAFRLSEHKPSIQFFGHTHLPTLFVLEGNDVHRGSIQRDYQPLLQKEERRYFVNPGSIGQPRDGDWRASLCILKLEEPQSVQVQFQRLEYDVEKTRQKILRAGLPKELGNRLLTGI